MPFRYLKIRHWLWNYLIGHGLNVFAGLVTTFWLCDASDNFRIVVRQTNEQLKLWSALPKQHSSLCGGTLRFHIVGSHAHLTTPLRRIIIEIKSCSIVHCCCAVICYKQKKKNKTVLPETFKFLRSTISWPFTLHTLSGDVHCACITITINCSILTNMCIDMWSTQQHNGTIKNRKTEEKQNRPHPTACAAKRNKEQQQNDCKTNKYKAKAITHRARTKPAHENKN